MKVVVSNAMLIELASKRARCTGGKLAIGCHPDTCPISKLGYPSRDNQSSCRATSSCMRLVQSIIYNFYKGTIGFVATWQALWMLVDSGFVMVNFGLGRGQRGLISSNLGLYRHLYPSRSTLTYLQGTPSSYSLLVGGVVSRAYSKPL